MKKYYIVAVYCGESQMWHMENGFYSKEDAKEEKEILKETYKAKDVKILTLANGKNDTVLSAMAELNKKD